MHLPRYIGVVLLPPLTGTPHLNFGYLAEGLYVLGCLGQSVGLVATTLFLMELMRQMIVSSFVNIFIYILLLYLLL